MLGKSLIKAAAGNAGAAVETDPNFADTTLLLQADDVNDGSQNNTFLDSSTNTHTIIRNGNVTQGSFSPFSQDEGKWGNYFDGDTGSLEVAYDSSFDFASSDFTIECWLNTNQTSISTIFDKRLGSTSDGILFLYNYSAGKITAFIDGPGWPLITSNINLPKNSWVHFAFTRSGSDFKMFFNGGIVGTTTSSTSVNDQAASLFIGKGVGSGFEFQGYISNVRIVKGTAVYTSAFTPPTEPLTDITNTSLLTCQSNRFVDNSSNAHAITVNGDPEVVPFSPFAPSTAYNPATKGGSALFADGANKYLSVAAGTDFNFGTGDFTIECWYYHLPKTTADVDRRYLIHTEEGWNGTRWILYTGIDSQKFSFYTYTDFVGNGNTPMLVSTSDLVLNQWHHLALTRSGNTFRIFINGVLEDSSTRYTGSVGADTYPTYIGGGAVQTNRMISGMVSDARIIKGTALYTANFTPPTAPLTAITNTSLLCNFTNAGIYDGTGRNVLETVGDAQVDAAVFKYGTGSMQFDGTGDGLVAPNSTTLEMGSGDFTWECWVYANTVATNFQGIIDTGTAGARATGALLYLGTSTLYYYSNSSNILSYSSFPTSQWVHVAVTRSGSSVRLFINGTQSGATGTSSTNMTTPIKYIGNTYDNFSFNGYIDDLRITKGVARYTANFTPPAAKLPNL